MRLHHEIHGDGPQTILFTHGLGMNGACWDAQVQALSKDFRIVTWDLRGHGRSETAGIPCTLTDLADDLGTVLDQAGVNRAILVGHSAGGVITLRFAIDNPEHVAGLVVVGSAGKCNQGAADFYEKLAVLALEGGIGPARQSLGLKGESGSAPQADPPTFAAVARCMGNLLHEPLTPELDKITCPTLIVVGENDFIGAGGSVTMSRHIPESRLEIVPGRGHGVFLEDPEGFNTLVREFALGPASSG